jgi:hypothetical protein
MMKNLFEQGYLCLFDADMLDIVVYIVINLMIGFRDLWLGYEWINVVLKLIKQVFNFIVRGSRFLFEEMLFNR